MKLIGQIQNWAKRSKQPIRLNGNPLGLGRLSAWHSPYRDETKPQNKLKL